MVLRHLYFNNLCLYIICIKYKYTIYTKQWSFQIVYWFEIKSFAHDGFNYNIHTTTPL